MQILDIIADAKEVKRIFDERQRIVDGAFKAIIEILSIPGAAGHFGEVDFGVRHIISHARRLLGSEAIVAIAPK